MVGIAQNGQRRLIFIVVPPVRTKMKEKGKRKNPARMDKSKENTIIYIDMYMYTHPQTYKHKYRYTYSQIYVMCLKVFKLFAFLIE